MLTFENFCQRRLKATHSNTVLLPRLEVRYVVLMQELRWAETFSMLDAIPIHDFVSNMQTIMLATTTALGHDCTIVSGEKTSSLETMSDAFLGLFDGPLLAKCAPGGQRLHDLSDAKTLTEQPTMKLLEILQRKMQVRKTFLTGGRMLRTIDEMIQKSLDALDGNDENPTSGVPRNRAVRREYSDLESQVHASPHQRPRQQNFSASYSAVASALPPHTSPFMKPQNVSRPEVPAAFNRDHVELPTIAEPNSIHLSSQPSSIRQNPV